MEQKNIILVGAPMDSGKKRQGCRMGPDAYRVAGLAEALTALGHQVEDIGDVVPDPENMPAHDHLVQLPECVGWTRALSRTAQASALRGMPVFLGGDHALAMGSVAGMAAYAKSQGRPLFVLWLDAHTDFHTPQSTESGNLHGTPVAYFTGQPGFHDFPALEAKVEVEHVGMMGLRSVDPAEHAALAKHNAMLADMRAIDEHGIKAPLVSFLDRVKAANGMLHVSLDVDFLDPSIAPAVGTTVPGGATEREAHLVMELLCDSGLVTSLDLVELNPFLDERGRTAMLMVDLTASLLGRRVFDRPTRSF
ncbi:arginase [Aliiroseovarius crassostreae]|uniref:Arginase n=1 Tax=Aliiroseovarius crassostreae TaxID=154981 RepID=A0A0P7KL43_9RHOB|nr:arginase [Aliiroseovarius crassostreae]KPN62692.1 arginase [Aliiroseovarius crassostreae]SFU93863.1 arginase [Aliiroseovarius crassostreae]